MTFANATNLTGNPGERSREICGSADLPWNPEWERGGWCFHADSVMIGGGCGT
jgi:hypothetical protein